MWRFGLLKSAISLSTRKDEDDEDDEDEDEEEEEEEEEETVTVESRSRLLSERAKMEILFRRISTENVPLRVHNILIKGNTKTKESLIVSEIEALKIITSVQELLQTARIANARLQTASILRIFLQIRHWS